MLISGRRETQRLQICHAILIQILGPALAGIYLLNIILFNRTVRVNTIGKNKTGGELALKIGFIGSFNWLLLH